MLKTIATCEVRAQGLEILKSGPKTRNELAKHFDLDKGSIYGHLHGYKRSRKSCRKSNAGLIDMGVVKMKEIPSERIYLLKTPTGGCG